MLLIEYDTQILSLKQIKFILIDAKNYFGLIITFGLVFYDERYLIKIGFCVFFDQLVF